jgi:hypothetical protein
MAPGSTVVVVMEHRHTHPASVVCTPDCTGTTTGLRWLRHPASLADPANGAGTPAGRRVIHIRDDGTLVLQRAWLERHHR